MANTHPNNSNRVTHSILPHSTLSNHHQCRHHGMLSGINAKIVGSSLTNTTASEPSSTPDPATRNNRATTALLLHKAVMATARMATATRVHTSRAHTTQLAAVNRKKRRAAVMAGSTPQPVSQVLQAVRC